MMQLGLFFKIECVRKNLKVCVWGTNSQPTVHKYPYETCTEITQSLLFKTSVVCSIFFTYTSVANNANILAQFRLFLGTV